MLNQLIAKASALGYNLKPTSVTSDYETAAINAFTIVFECVPKGCHFHFTQANWKNIQKLGLTDEYKSNPQVRELLDDCKTMPFVPIGLINTVWTLILNKLTLIVSKKLKELKEYVLYFYNTWLINPNYPIALWNHYETIGPRTNNHLEGYNFKINTSIDYNHPHIYSAIGTFQQLEATTSLNYLNLQNGSKSQFPRRPEDKKRDEMILHLKFKLDNGTIDIQLYLTRVSQLFNLDKTVPKTVATTTTTTTAPTIPFISIFALSNQTFFYVSKYLKDNRLQFVHLVKNMRCIIGNFVSENQILDNSFNYILCKYSYNCKSINTSRDGNCLYHAISLALLGNESISYRIKLAMIFIIFEYEEYFRKLVTEFAYVQSFENMVLKSAKLGIYGNEFNMIVLSILFLRPVFCYTNTASYIADAVKSLGQALPIYLALNSEHFSPIVAFAQDSRIFLPTSNHLNFFRENINEIDYY
jgi:hypothetical protein